MKRIQRKRRTGWKMPANTIYVGRPSPWGNPFQVIGGMMYCYSINRQILSPWILWDHSLQKEYTKKDAVELYEQWIKGELYETWLPPVPDLESLRGKDLACWCPLEEPYCHADVLLKLLKDGEQTEIRLEER